MPDTIMKCERTDHWIKMRPSRARSSAQAASCHILSSVDFITSTFESEFLVHTGVLAPHTRPDSFSSSAITPHSPSDRSWRGASFQYPRGFVQFCPVVSNFVHEPSCLIARYAVGSGQVRYHISQCFCLVRLVCSRRLGRC